MVPSPSMALVPESSCVIHKGKRIPFDLSDYNFEYPQRRDRDKPTSKLYTTYTKRSHLKFLLFFLNTILRESIDPTLCSSLMD
jgi:hypothetical protein